MIVLFAWMLCRARDVLQLPKPYDNIKSDIVKKWLKVLNAGGTIDVEEYPHFKKIKFSNALILKVNQLCKQVRTVWIWSGATEYYLVFFSFQEFTIGRYTLPYPFCIIGEHVGGQGGTPPL